MKAKCIICVIALLFITNNSQAQFLKKLKNKIQEKAENVIVEKTSDKVAEKTSNSLDNAFNMNPFGKGANKVEPSLIPDYYNFSWKYSMLMKTNQGDITFDYFLQPGESYFGFNMPTMENKAAMGDLFMVMDNGRKITITFIKSDKNSMAMASSMPDDLDFEDTNDKAGDFNYEILPDKKIMGYTCKGVKATSEDYEMTMYFTTEAPVSFNDIYKNKQSNIPEGLKKYFKENERSLMLEMQMTDRKKSKNNATMECIGLEEVQKQIDKSNYNFMNQ